MIIFVRIMHYYCYQITQYLNLSQSKWTKNQLYWKQSPSTKLTTISGKQLIPITHGFIINIISIQIWVWKFYIPKNIYSAFMPPDFKLFQPSQPLHKIIKLAQFISQVQNQHPSPQLYQQQQQIKFQMKLSEQERIEAEKKLKHLSSELTITEAIKNKTKEISKKIQGVLAQIKQTQKDSPAQIDLLAKFTEKALEETIKLQSLESQYSNLEEKVKSQKEKAINERIKTVAEKQKYSEAIQDIKSTIAKIQKTVKDAQADQDQKRTNIEKDLEKSLGQIRDKIKTQDEQAVTTNQETVGLKSQIAELRTKLQGLQGIYQAKATQKQDEVKKDKGDLLDKLKVLEQEATEINRVNTQFNTVEKKNFDNKLSIYIRQTKFSDYAGSFENTARVLSQCKDELFKGVQRLNELQTKKDTLQSNAEKYDKQFLALLGTNNSIKQQIEKIKKAKETVRSNILTLQSEIKAKKQPKTN